MALNDSVSQVRLRARCLPYQKGTGAETLCQLLRGFFEAGALLPFLPSTPHLQAFQSFTPLPRDGLPSPCPPPAGVSVPPEAVLLQGAGEGRSGSACPHAHLQIVLLKQA